MNCRLTIGILKAQPGWQILLEQLGVVFEEIVQPEDIRADNFSAIVVNSRVSLVQNEAIQQYMRDGGAILDCGNYLMGNRGDMARVGVRDYAGGWIGVPGTEINAAIIDTHARRRVFYSPGGAKPSEVVSRVSKNEVRKIVENLLRNLHLQRQLPYIHRWYFPYDWETIFCYRIDSDYGNWAQISTLHDIAQNNSIRMTWFLHVEAHEAWLHRFAQFTSQEIGIHCYKHKTYRTYEENWANIAEALFLLNREGIDCRGFASPNGIWNRNLGMAVQAHGFHYSSEFALDYDNLPFHPLLSYRFSSALQVPIHPVSIGNFLRVGAQADDMNKYYENTMDGKLANHEPIIFYHHPTHEFWGVVESIFKNVRDRNLQNLTMGEYSQWWRLRGQACFDAYVENGKTSITYSSGDPSVFIRIETADGTVRYCDSASGAEQGVAQQHVSGNQPVNYPGAMDNRQPFDLKTVCHSLEDINTRARQ